MAVFPRPSSPEPAKKICLCAFLSLTVWGVWLYCWGKTAQMVCAGLNLLFERFIKMENSVFSDSFVNSVTAALNEGCPEGSGTCMTRTVLAEKIGLDKKLECVLGPLVSLGHVEGYEVRKGPRGGIGRAGERPPKIKSTPSAPKLGQGFIDNLKTALVICCDDNGTPVPRPVIAKEMGIEGQEQLISAALKLDEFSNYSSKVGKGGGILRNAALSSDEFNVGEELTASMQEQNDADESVSVDESPEVAVV